MSDDVLHGVIIITVGGHICWPLIDNDLHTFTYACAHTHTQIHTQRLRVEKKMFLGTLSSKTPCMSFESTFVILPGHTLQPTFHTEICDLPDQ